MKEIKRAMKSEMKLGGGGIGDSLPASDDGIQTLLTVQDVAEILKVPVSWVYEHAREGCRQPLPHLKLGKYLRFLAADVLDYLERMRPNNRPQGD